MPIASDYYLANCTAQRLEDPSLILQSPVVRPEDLAGYRRLTNHYCLVPRSTRRRVAQVEILDAYARERYDGDYLDLLGNRGSPTIRNLRLPNRALDGAWETMWKDCMAAGQCDVCNYCRDLVDRVLDER
jgi:hypothetical protein